MHGPPGKLGGLAFHRAAAEHLHDSGSSADRGHRPLVVVPERLDLVARDPPGEHLTGVLSGLKRDRAELG